MISDTLTRHIVVCCSFMVCEKRFSGILADVAVSLHAHQIFYILHRYVHIDGVRSIMRFRINVSYFRPHSQHPLSQVRASKIRENLAQFPFNVYEFTILREWNSLIETTSFYFFLFWQCDCWWRCRRAHGPSHPFEFQIMNPATAMEKFNLDKIVIPNNGAFFLLLSYPNIPKMGTYRFITQSKCVRWHKSRRKKFWNLICVNIIFLSMVATGSGMDEGK